MYIIKRLKNGKTEYFQGLYKSYRMFTEYPTLAKKYPTQRIAIDEIVSIKEYGIDYIAVEEAQECSGYN